MTPFLYGSHKVRADPTSLAHPLYLCVVLSVHHSWHRVLTLDLK